MTRCRFNMIMRVRSVIVAAVVCLAVLGLRHRWNDASRDQLQQSVLQPVVLGTTSRLIAVGPADQLEPALAAALRQIRAVEQAMSTYNPTSELSRFNAAAANVEVPLSQPTLSVMQSAQHISAASHGAFDVTVHPLTLLWSAAAEQERLPSERQLAVTLEKVGYEKLKLSPRGARKAVAGLQVSLDGIAKGYAIHRALDAMREYELSGGLVDIGGDIECFGRPADGNHWSIAVQSPWQEEAIELLAVKSTRGAAICTSGDYRRYFLVGDKRYSQIIDPRSGYPANQACSVTVIAPDAVQADGWATALSVLGSHAGMKIVAAEPQVEALFVSGSATEPLTSWTPGFQRYRASGGR